MARLAPYTVAELAKELRMPKGAIYEEIKAGRLHARPRRGHVRPLYVTEREVIRWTTETFDRER